MDKSADKRFLQYLFPGMILLVAVVLRLVYFAEIVHSPTFSHPLYDPEYNAHWARGIATGNWTPPPGVNDPEITTTPHGRPPGYPWFLSAVYIIFGVNDYAPRIIQMLMGVINALLMYLLGRRIFDDTTAFIAGLFMAGYWVFPYFEGILTYPVLAVLLLLCLLLTLEGWLRHSRLMYMALAGALLGAFALLRPNVLLFGPVLAGWAAWQLRKKQHRLATIFLSLSILTIACIGVLAPAFIRNHIVAKDFVFLSAYGGINLYVGNHPEASLVEPQIPELLELAGIDNWTCFDYPAIVRGIAAKEGKQNISFSEANRYFYSKALEFIKEDPGLFLRNMLHKALLFWGPYEITNDTVMEYDKQHSPVLRFLPGFSWFAALFACGTIIMVCSHGTKNKPYNPMLGLLWLFTSTYFLSVILFFVAGRYRVPIMPILLLFSAVAVVWLIRTIRARKFGHVAAGLALMLLLIVFFRSNPTGYVPNPGTWHLRTAMAHTAAGNNVKAEAAYRNALQSGANPSVAYANLGRIYINRGDIKKGITYYRKGLQHNPNSSIIHNNLGYELYRQGELAEARQHFEQAIKLNPRFALAYINLGNLLLDQGKPEQGLEHFEQAAAIKPENSTISYNIARSYFDIGNYEKAIETYQYTLSLNPEFTEALNNLGYTYAAQKEYERAIPLYEKAIKTNPDFLLAYNNLGNAYFEMGELDAAADAYNKALERHADAIDARYNLGRVAAARQEWDTVISTMKKVLESSPEEISAMKFLGNAYLQQDNLQEAISVLNQAAALAPLDSDVLLLLGETYEQAGNIEDALKTYTAILNSFKEDCKRNNRKNEKKEP